MFAILIILFVLLIIYFIYSYFKKSCSNRAMEILAQLNIKPNSKILDIGCGKCCQIADLKKQGYDVYSFDVVNKGECIKPIIFDGKKIPYPNNFFDFAICSFMLHITENQIELLKELKRTAKIIIVIEDTIIY